MSKDYAVSVKFSLEDEISEKITGISSKFKSLESITGFSGKLLGKTFGAVKAVAAPAFSALSAGIASSVQSYIAFDDVLTGANAKFGGTAETMAALRDAALDVAGATRFNSLDTSGALDKMAMAGMSAADSIAMLRPMADMAMATGKDMTSAVDMATDALGAFNMMKDAAGNPLSGEALGNQLRTMSDIVSKATNAANFDMDMWFESAKQGASTFTSFGGTLAEFSAIAGLLANSGVKGSAGGTAIRNIMLGMSGTTATAKESLAALGIQSYDAQGKMRPFADLVEQLSNSLAGLDDEQKAFHLSKLFGKENISSALLLVQEGADKIREFTAELQESTGATDEMAAKMNASIGGRIEMLKSALDSLGNKFVAIFDTERGRALIDSLTDKISQFTQKIIPAISQSLDAVLPQIEAGLETAFSMIPALIDGLARAIPSIMAFMGKAVDFVGILWNFRTPLLVLYGIVALANPIFQMFRAFSLMQTLFFGIKDGAVIASRALRGLDASAKLAAQFASPLGQAFGKAFTGIGNAARALFISSPIGWIILGIGALIALIVSVTTHWETWGRVATGALTLIAPPLGLILGIAHSIYEKWGEIKAAFTEQGFVAGLFAIGDAIRGGIIDALNECKNIVSNIPVLGDILGAGLDFVIEKVDAIFASISNVKQAFSDGGLLGGLLAIGAGIVSNILSPIQFLLKGISMIPGMDWAKNAYNALSNFTNGLTGAGQDKNAISTNVSDFVPTKTSAESAQYSRSESVSKSEVELKLAAGLETSSTGAPGVTFSRHRTGGF